ncbi:RecD DNA helicase YrrC [Streptomyces xiamenensis]|uniref:RecD DNA helicase YrrC n=1 Tax=Streptomyces xiamenensis TaxID=408015 RepID=A0A0F7FPE0_9ACTN|nr:helix-hairpin-helix domain-containing protein [Streptomyces xiamenensis]AKG41883.1 RecD DNA helicase YrrC [Streptomyces xiamenensis]
MTAENQSPQPAEGTPAGGLADALRAAVRAVESGERPATSFFTRPEPAPRPAAARAVARAGAQPAGGGAPVAVPAELVELLERGGAPGELGGRVAAALGESAAAELAGDPWRLLAVPGMLPGQVDGFARALLGTECDPQDPRRGVALTVWLLERAALAGHTALEAAALAEALAGQRVADPEETLRAAVEEGAVLVFQDTVVAAGAGEETPVRVLFGLDRYALAEESLADGLARLRGSAPAGDTDSARGWEEAAAGAPTPSAAELIKAVAAHPVVAHSGGEAARAEPAALVAAARRLGLRAFAAAHGPDGRQRLARALPPQDADAAVTVSGLLGGTEGPERDADGALALDVLAVLDAPQLTVETAATLVESLPDGARLVLSGDPAVLGAAGPGQVLADVAACGGVPHLTSRTPDEGPVGELVSGIAIGELYQVEAPGKEVVIVPAGDAGEAVHRTVQLVTDSIPRAVGIPAAEVRVITVGHGGAAGTRVLNAALKERLNPGPGRFGGFDPGDQVTYSPAPGRSRPATVTGADADGLHLTAQEGPFTVPRERVAGTVRHGWAITAHQAAAARWPAVVVVLPGDAVAALDRSWIYTAFSRAERHLSVVQGIGPALAQAVAAPPAAGRGTRLAALLRPQPVAGG